MQNPIDESRTYCSFENKLEDFNMKKTRQTADGVFLCNVAVSHVFFYQFLACKIKFEISLITHLHDVDGRYPLFPFPIESIKQ